MATAQKVPKFTSPGPAISNAGTLKGQKIMAIPGSSQLAACEQMVEAEKSLGAAVGTPVTIYNNDGLTSQWDSGIETAISHRGCRFGLAPLSGAALAAAATVGANAG